jgi:hypothetical protein
MTKKAAKWTPPRLHSDRIPARADANLNSEWLVVMRGPEGGVVPCDGVEIPIGMAGGAKKGEVTVLYLFGRGHTHIMRGAAPISADDILVTAPHGLVKPLPTAVGTYCVVGQALEPSDKAGQEIEVNDCFPHPLTVT